MSYMRDDFDGILRQYGHNIYLNRRIRADADGTGSYADKFEIHTVRYDRGGSLQSAQDEAAEGIITSSERLYYFRYNAVPFDGDRIYEHDPRVVQTVWQIDTAIPMRGLNGDIEYYIAGASRIRPN